MAITLIRIHGAIGACLFLGTFIPRHAFADQAGDKQTKSDTSNKPDRPAASPAQPKRNEQEARAWQQGRGWLQSDAWPGKDTWQEHRAYRWSNDHRTWAQRGGYGGAYISQDQFNRNFGPEHRFRLHGRPTLFMGFPRFESNGVSFLLVDPWPEYWPENWYDFDDVYVVYDNGYYLCNRAYTQVRLAVAIVL